MNYRKLIIGNHLYFGRDDNDNFVEKTGTVAVTNGLTAVVGTGTAFTTDAPAASVLNIGGVRVTVAAVTDDTHLTLTNPYGGFTASLIPYWKQTNASINFNTKPDSTHWLSVGDIEDVNIDPTRDEQEIFSPSPGHYVLSAKLVKFARLKFEFVLQDMSELFYEMLLSSVGPLTADVIPYSASGVINGWFRISQFSQSDAQNAIIECWGRAVAGATKFGNEHTKGKVTLELLKNPLNSGTLSLSA